ncbi:hypothetical protein KC19_10G099700 [Ceratodon purpureus]|uniref:Patatin n=1 Tax=Ceratodon purpureus TaxID=3225 RepID=A0A8T0GIT9_CERPU|nr:hypothetical protein KC19_10G099700 [Ceratodon purpureus]
MLMAGEKSNVQPASSSSSEVSPEEDDVDGNVLSSPDVEPIMCSECTKTPASCFCPKCGESGVPLCEECDRVVVHNSRATRSHERMPIHEHRIVEICMGSSSPTDDQICLDEYNNKLFFFSPIDHRIQLLPRLGSLVTDPDMRPSLVTFIGPTGVGKSTLMRMLISLEGVSDPGLMPLAGAPDNPQSTSADVHIYGGGQLRTSSDVPRPAVDSTYPLLYLDSEGIRGATEPRCISNLWDKVKSLYGHIEEKNRGEFLKKRSEHVQASYPRMLYNFSSVLCFVFSGSCKERESIVEPLLEWGESAAAGAANQHRPQLIIIFNKTGPKTTQPVFNDSRVTYQNWIAGYKNVGQSKDDKILEYYYSDPRVIHICRKEVDSPTFLRQVKILRKEIHDSSRAIRTSREKTNQLFTCRQLQNLMQLAADTFSDNSTGDFDLYKASMARRPIAVGLEGFIFEFYRGVEQAADTQCRSKLERYRISLSVLHGLIGWSVLLWMARLNENFPVGANAQLHEKVREALENAQKTIDGEEPCAAVSSAGRPCDVNRVMHESATIDREKSCAAVSSAGRPCGVNHVMHESAKEQCHVTRLIDGKSDVWKGVFTSDPNVKSAAEQCRLVTLAESALRTATTLDVQVIRRLLSEAAQRSEYAELLKSSDLFYHVCVSCMVDLPTEMLSCGHIICAMCAKEVTTEPRLSKIIDLRCPVCLSPNSKWYPNDLPPLAGYRILSLDGGGVRGIVELLALQEIMSYFPEMHIEDLFDIVIGTSTGGIIALALTAHKLNEKPKRLPDVIVLFEELVKEVFSSKMLSLPVLGSNSILSRLFQALRFTDSKYKNENLLMLLEKHFGKESMLRSCVGGPHVIVTTLDRDPKAVGAWFTSYNRPMQKNKLDELFQLECGADSKDCAGRVPNNHLFSPKDAAAATSAAGTYFPAYKANGKFWIDGGLRYNGPAGIAIEEARTMWPGRGTSALISLGCGRPDSDKKIKPQLSFHNNVRLVVDVATDAESQISKAINDFERLQPGSRSVRLNPKLRKGKKYELDDASKLPDLKTLTKEYLETHEGRAKVQNAANVLFANLFYLVDGNDRDSLVPKPNMISIRSRSALPEKLRAVLTDAPFPPFSVKVCEVAGAISEFRTDQLTWEFHSSSAAVMNLPFILSGLPAKRPLKVEVKLNAFLTTKDRKTAPEGWSGLPISGMSYFLRS